MTKLARDVPAAHAAIAPPATLRRERRALYQLAIELLEHGGRRVLDVDVIDSPVARNSIGAALAGRTRLASSALVGLSAVSATTSVEQKLRVASRPEANALLAPALETLRAELGRQQAACGAPALLTEADGQRFTAALATLHDGVALAHSVSTELAEDLLAHVALVGVLDPHCADRLVSASPREFPGLVLIRAPRSAIEVAEALVHEGAHQKLFDLALTHDMLDAGSDTCPPFHPPWAPECRRWPLEQTLAACHAYICLARFGRDLDVAASTCRPGPESLLPLAGQRSEILSEWLLSRGDYLGPDAHLLLSGLVGRWPHVSRTADTPSGRIERDYVLDTPLELRRCGSTDRVLVGRPSRPPQLYWVSDDAATVLELLAQGSQDEIPHRVADRWNLSQFDAAGRLTALLSDLCRSGLVASRDPAVDET